MPPLNLVADFGGGGMLLGFGILAALLESRQSDRGQIVDAAMIDGASTLMAMMYGMRAQGRWSAPRAGNLLDGSAWCYTCYETADGGWMAVGCLESQFRKVFFEKLGFGGEVQRLCEADPHDAELRTRLEAMFLGKPRMYWEGLFRHCDACVAPGLAMDEVMSHPHNQVWGSFVELDGVVQPTPAPRFSRTPTELSKAQPGAS